MRQVLFLFTLLISGSLYSQDKEVLIKGRVVDIFGESNFTGLYVVNQRLGVGNFSNPNGEFKIRARKNDTILVGSLGYMTAKISMVDSVYQEVYQVRVILHELKFQLQEVSVFAERDLEEIYEEIEELGVEERLEQLEGWEAVQSPITALYMTFSRRERRLQETYEIINNDRRRKLLKELFEKYVDYHIIEMEDNEFDRFIDFCRIDDQTLQTLTQYEFIVLIKRRYYDYRRLYPDDYYWENSNWD